MISLIQLAKVRHRVSQWVVGHEDEVATIAALDAVLEADQTYRCSQHIFRATPLCNDNPNCSLQLGVFVPVTPILTEAEIANHWQAAKDSFVLLGPDKARGLHDPDFCGICEDGENLYQADVDHFKELIDDYPGQHEGPWT